MLIPPGGCAKDGRGKKLSGTILSAFDAEQKLSLTPFQYGNFPPIPRATAPGSAPGRPARPRRSGVRERARGESNERGTAVALSNPLDRLGGFSLVFRQIASFEHGIDEGHWALEVEEAPNKDASCREDHLAVAF